MTNTGLKHKTLLKISKYSLFLYAWQQLIEQFVCKNSYNINLLSHIYIIILSVQKGIERTYFNSFSKLFSFLYVSVITVVPWVKYMAFICRSDSRSTLRKQFHPKDGIMGTAIFRGFFTNLLRSRPSYELGDVGTVLSACLTLQCMQGWEHNWKGKRCTYSCRHVEK